MLLKMKRERKTTNGKPKTINDQPKTNRMTVSHRAQVRQMKVARMACCCKLSELLPLVRQLHEQSRTAYSASQHEKQARPEAA